MWRVNVDGTDHVVEACRRAGVRRLIHCSSVDAIGLPEGSAPSREETPWNWDRLGVDNPYARTKWESQRRVLAAAVRDVDAVVVNPTYMFGPWDARPSSGRMILEVAAGKAIGWTSGGNNFVDVEDVVLAMVAAAERGARGECYILGHANLTYREVFGEIARVLGVRPPAIRHPVSARAPRRLGRRRRRCSDRDGARRELAHGAARLRPALLRSVESDRGPRSAAYARARGHREGRGLVPARRDAARATELTLRSSGQSAMAPHGDRADHRL